jgi:uncharacterized protein YukE
MAIFDADDLVRIAGRIDDQAESLRAKARSLTSAAHHVRWHSLAASTFRAQVGTLDRRMQHAAHDLERAAHELRLHAGRVRTVQAAMAVAGRVERLAAREGTHVAVNAAKAVGHASGWLEDHL